VRINCAPLADCSPLPERACAGPFPCHRISLGGHQNALTFAVHSSVLPDCGGVGADLRGIHAQYLAFSLKTNFNRYGFCGQDSANISLPATLTDHFSEHVFLRGSALGTRSILQENGMGTKCPLPTALAAQTGESACPRSVVCRFLFNVIDDQHR
jgi:hypothetical protein